MASAPWGWCCCFCWQKLWKPKAGVPRKFLYSQGKRVNFFHCWLMFYVCICMCTRSLIAGRVCAALVRNIFARVRGPRWFRQFCLKGDLCCERIRTTDILCYPRTCHIKIWVCESLLFKRPSSSMFYNSWCLFYLQIFFLKDAWTKI